MDRAISLSAEEQDFRSLARTHQGWLGQGYRGVECGYLLAKCWQHRRLSRWRQETQICKAEMWYQARASTLKTQNSSSTFLLHTSLVLRPKPERANSMLYLRRTIYSIYRCSLSSSSSSSIYSLPPLHFLAMLVSWIYPCRLNLMSPSLSSATEVIGP
jgi:hypothetical protein